MYKLAAINRLFGSSRIEHTGEAIGPTTGLVIPIFNLCRGATMNKQDQEQHRLAALAAGYKAKKGASGRFFKWESSGNFDEWWQVWHPKTCKVDSFDLMVECFIAVSMDDSGVKASKRVRYNGEIDDIISSFALTHKGYRSLSECAMKAIFKCAVEIGRSMEAQDNEP